MQRLISGQLRTVRLGKPRGDSVADTPAALFPGSFNPLHEGHCEIVRVAKSRLKCDAHYELSVTNVDKPTLNESEIESRLSQFAPHNLVWLTRAPTFVDKSRLFPGVTFIVGADTIARITDPRYYDGSQSKVRRDIQEIADRGCCFLVFGRVLDDAFRSLSDLRLAEELARICTEVTEAEFRSDIRSTDLRVRGTPRGRKS